MHDVRGRQEVSKWFLRQPSAKSDALLFCVPYTGCGASMYRKWPRFIGGIEVCPIQLPGRENRLREPTFKTHQELASDIIKALGGYLDRPFGLFGHCGSALSCYEMAVQLTQRDLYIPRCLFVSSQVAPQDGPYGSYLSMNDTELIEEVARLIRETGGGVPHPELLKICAEVMRSDVDANGRYVMPEPIRIPCQIFAIGWRDDTVIRADQMQGWPSCGRTVFRLLDGSHYAFVDAPVSLLATLAEGMGWPLSSDQLAELQSI
jgi:surfactin synthase thioesterase subunit